MPFIDGYDQAEAQVMMTLSALAYAKENPYPGESLPHHQSRIRDKITNELTHEGYATSTDWEFAWGPGLTVGNMMYVAKKKLDNQYAVVVRGTDWSFFVDWLEDLDVLKLVPFPYVSTQDPSVRIAKGTMDGLNSLLGMTGSAIVDSQPQPAELSLLQFVMHQAMSTEDDMDIFVTGHSLGGALASVVAAWLAYETFQWAHVKGEIRIKNYTFAAPSAGNESFASGYDSLFGPDAIRVYNSLDVVPNAWQTLGTVKSYYQPSPPCHVSIKLLIDGAEAVLSHDKYSQPASAHELPGAVNPAYEGDSLHDFFNEVGYQHGHNTYLTLLGAKAINF